MKLHRRLTVSADNNGNSVENFFSSRPSCKGIFVESVDVDSIMNEFLVEDSGGLTNVGGSLCNFYHFPVLDAFSFSLISGCSIRCELIVHCIGKSCCFGIIWSVFGASLSGLVDPLCNKVSQCVKLLRILV